MSSTTGQQFEILVSFMEDNEGIAKNYLNGPQFKETTQHLWSEVTKKLNEAGPPEKTIEGWKKVWKDFKYSIKNKLRINKKMLTGTGGGPNRLRKFSHLEERVDKLLDLSGEIEGLNVKTFGCKIVTAPDESRYYDNLSIDTQEFEAEILNELSGEFLSTTNNIEQIPASPARQKTKFRISPSTSRNKPHTSPSTISNKPASRLNKKERETSKMLLKKQISLQENHHKEFKKFAENVTKYLKENNRILKEIRNTNTNLLKLDKEKWISKQKILLESNKLKVEKLELKRIVINLKQQKLKAAI